MLTSQLDPVSSHSPPIHTSSTLLLLIFVYRIKPESRTSSNDPVAHQPHIPLHEWATSKMLTHRTTRNLQDVGQPNSRLIRNKTRVMIFIAALLQMIMLWNGQWRLLTQQCKGLPRSMELWLCQFRVHQFEAPTESMESYHHPRIDTTVTKASFHMCHHQFVAAIAKLKESVEMHRQNETTVSTRENIEQLRQCENSARAKRLLVVAVNMQMNMLRQATINLTMLAKALRSAVAGLHNMTPRQPHWKGILKHTLQLMQKPKLMRMNYLREPLHMTANRPAHPAKASRMTTKETR